MEWVVVHAFNGNKEPSMLGMSKTARTVSWVLQVVVALILAQTLFFKFTAAPESVYIFQTLGMEPWGRIGSGVAELIAVVLMMMPRTVVFGAGLALGVITGAVMSHLTKLGIVVQDDGGLLFGLAVVVLGSSLTILWLRRGEVRRMVLERALGRMVGR